MYHTCQFDLTIDEFLSRMFIFIQCNARYDIPICIK